MTHQVSISGKSNSLKILKDCRFMMHEFIVPKGRHHPDNGHMTDNAALCDWVGVSQDKLRIVHTLFKHYLGV
jgi:hypothetical protein